MRRMLKLLTVLGFVAAFAVPAVAQDGISAFHEGFEQSIGGWITDDTSGEAGWCGDIEHFATGSGPVSPSAGSGYAVVRHGPCNDYWTENGFPNGSGSYRPFGEFSESWPERGFTTELDIYLDPAWESGASFSYASALLLLDGTYPDNVRYLIFPVAKENGELTVAGNAVSEAGWYTFRQRFMNESGQLAVDFELVRDGESLFTQDVTTTGFSEEEVSSFAATNVGTGYAWFVSISEGLGVPIDEQRLLPAAAMEEEPAVLPETGVGNGGVRLRNAILLLAGGVLLAAIGFAIARRRRASHG